MRLSQAANKQGLIRNAAQVFKDVIAHAHWKLENVFVLLRPTCVSSLIMVIRSPSLFLTRSIIVQKYVDLVLLQSLVPLIFYSEAPLCPNYERTLLGDREYG